MKASPNQLEPIPHPPRLPIIGNFHQIAISRPMSSIIQLATDYGPIADLRFMKQRLILVSNYELVNEISDETRFGKQVKGVQAELRDIAKDGLFTAHTHEPNWQKAHNILLPGFGMQYMQHYFPLMLELTGQLIAKWEQPAPNAEINVPEDMTRLTLDTIGLCGFDYRFNSFSSKAMHPFVAHMLHGLHEMLKRNHRLPILKRFTDSRNHQLQEDIAFMNNLIDNIIAERKQDEEGLRKKDFLNLMMHGVDKQTQEKLDDENMRYQILTFLIAGHETTGIVLSFAIYYLLKNPAVLARAYEEVDRVLGADPNVKPVYKQVSKLKYITQILKETLRIRPIVPAIRIAPHQDTVIGGRYKVAKDTGILAVLHVLHRDKTIWGDDVETFDPDRFLLEAERARPTNAYKPFGNGKRACIGRHFAMFEATLALSMILQRFELIDHTNYQLQIDETFVPKPADFKITVKPRR